MNRYNLLVLTLSVAALLPAAADETTQLWEKNCAKCHGRDGKGDTKIGKKAGIVDLTDAKVQEKYNDDELLKRIKEGVKDEEGRIKMAPAETLSEAEIKDLIAFVRKLKK